MNLSNIGIFNTILVHVSRTWERIRVTQPFEEMPMDNIESVDFIVDVSDRIYNDAIMHGFIANPSHVDYFLKTTGVLSDTYIENQAMIIFKKDLDIKN